MAISIQELLARQYDATSTLVEPGVLIRGGLMVLAGEPKVGKSYLTLHMLCGLASGTTLLPGRTTPHQEHESMDIFPVRGKHKCLYVEAEVGARMLRERLMPIVPHYDVGDRLWVASREYLPQLDKESGMGELLKDMERLKPDVVCLDPLADMLVGDENSSQVMGAAMTALLNLRATYNCAIILIHHTSKPSVERTGFHRLRGHSKLQGAYDTAVIAEFHNRNAFAVKLSFDGRHFGSIQDGVWKLTSKTGAIEYRGPTGQKVKPAIQTTEVDLNSG